MDVVQAVRRAGWFDTAGAYFIVDGQFGSTGKGALAALLGAIGSDQITMVTTNAGPNSGHTGYMPASMGGEKIITRQIPVAAVMLKKLGVKRTPPRDVPAYLNAGAIIDPEVLDAEIREHNFSYRNLIVHPVAAVIEPVDREAEGLATSGPAKIASTGKGVGSAMARKVMRQGNVVGTYLGTSPFYKKQEHYWNPEGETVLVESAQGFSLGINTVEFYPHTTSRECTVQQAMADARMPLSMRRKVAMCVRTFPIRVGNTKLGNSGPCYTDQRETSWEELGVEPELTTVTQRVRRVFTWSRQQFMDAVLVNEPDLLFVTFIDYLPVEERSVFFKQLLADYRRIMGRYPETVLYSTGPRPEDVSVFNYGAGEVEHD